jgi:hypothetical protein
LTNTLGHTLALEPTPTHAHTHTRTPEHAPTLTLEHTHTPTHAQPSAWPANDMWLPLFSRPRSMISPSGSMPVPQRMSNSASVNGGAHLFLATTC